LSLVFVIQIDVLSWVHFIVTNVVEELGTVTHSREPSLKVRLTTIDHLIKVSCLVTKVNNIINIKSN
jgi:hypothetical protein